MKNFLKKSIKTLIPGIVFNGINAYRLQRKYRRNGINVRVIGAFHKQASTKEYISQFMKATKETSIKSDYYINPLDPAVIRQIPFHANQIVSITPDFAKILDFTITDYRQLLQNSTDNRFKRNHIKLINGIEAFAKRIADEIDGKDERKLVLKGLFSNILYRKPVSFDEALQKILFFDGLFWQMNHKHIGLGRLDAVLIDYYRQDIQKGTIDRGTAGKMIHEFLYSLSRDTKAKSVSLIGDTGQYILLGGVDKAGNNVDNEITELFLEIFAEYDRPDPKLILRVNGDTSRTIWQKAVKCLATGIGSPLIMNEKVVMQGMDQFGYRKEDLYQLGTSACWEPLIIGKSFDQNNPLPNIVSLAPLNAMLKGKKPYADFNEFLSDYKSRLGEHIRKSVKDINFDVSPLFTLFTDDCLEQSKDFTQGGARYNYHGIQIVSFPNTINALLNIKKYVFEDKLLSLEQCNDFVCKNYNGSEDLLLLMQSNPEKYGSTKENVVSLTNDLIDFVGSISDGITINGKKVKVGFSSSQYIAQSVNFEASLDGRRQSEPFAVHISPVSSNIDIVEILDFASLLHYDKNKMNGNVVDFTIPDSFIQSPDKLIDLLAAACKKGVFQIQLNVLKKEVLIDAKAHPEKYPQLIVRVWGFSAYYNDLPEAYKDNLIRRATLYAS